MNFGMSYLGGRLLQPAGGYAYRETGANLNYVSGPGTGGRPNATSGGGAGGIFAGGSLSTVNAGGQGGMCGGGGGGSTSSSAGGIGGVGGVIIEYNLS
jgi:hypothetical protein